jgi:MFS family permease
VNSRYVLWRKLRRYLGGAAAARAGDEMSGPALLLLGFAVTRGPAAGSELLASLTVAAAVGGPAFGTLLDRSRRPARLLGGTLGVYALGIVVISAALGRVPMAVVVLLALLTGVFNPAVAGGWTAQLPRLVTGAELSRGSALDALSYSAASLAGPALAAVIAAGLGARVAVLAAAGLVALAVPAAWSLASYPSTAGKPAPPGGTPQATPFVAGFAAIAKRPRLLRATATSAVSYVGIGMLVVCCPVLGAQRLGGAARGALLISAIAVASLVANAILARRPWRGEPDGRVLGSTLVIGASLAAAAVAPGWLTMAAVAAGGAGEGPQLTALFAVRHRETPEHMRGQIYTTAASLKIAGLAAGAALAGPLASRSVTACLLVAAGSQLCAAAVYLLTGPGRVMRAGATTAEPEAPEPREPAAEPAPESGGSAAGPSKGPGASTAARSGE